MCVCVCCTSERRIGAGERIRAVLCFLLLPHWSPTQTMASYGGLRLSACLRTSRGVWCLRHAVALAWRRGPVRGLTRGG